MRRKIIFIFLFFAVSYSLTNLKAQIVNRDVFVQNHMKDKKPVSYQYLREADVMWSKTIWRMIELKEKMNLPLYYPEQVLGDRMSFVSVLLYGVKNQGLTAYDEDDQTGDEFATVLTQDKIQERLGAGRDVQQIEDPETGEIQELVVETDGRPQEVKSLLMKEVWFFDKQRSVMEVRIVGICPIRWFRRDPNDTESPLEPKKLFWIYYPEARKILANHYIFNPNNDLRTRSFDDVFSSRMFSSYIVRESNAYNDRPINTYTSGLESMLEAERIENNIFNYEQDLWHY